METDDKKEKDKVTGVLFVGCMFVGMGIGFVLHQMPAGLFIGMGVGFLTSAAYRARNN